MDVSDLNARKDKIAVVAASAVAADKTTEILKALEKLLNDEWLTYYQYWTAYESSRGQGKYDVDPEFEEHAKNEKHHADLLMQRINQLGGKPTMDPTLWRANAHPWEPLSSPNVKPILKAIRDSEVIAIAGYEDLIEMTKDCDHATYLLAVKILSDENDHLYDIDRLFEAV